MNRVAIDHNVSQAHSEQHQHGEYVNYENGINAWGDSERQEKESWNYDKSRRRKLISLREFTFYRHSNYNEFLCGHRKWFFSSSIMASETATGSCCLMIRTRFARIPRFYFHFQYVFCFLMCHFVSFNWLKYVYWLTNALHYLFLIFLFR